MTAAKWDRRFIEMAKLVASWSKDPSTKCGAVIVRPDKTVCSVGYNGFPRWCDDSEELYANRELKYQRVVHAEMNAILHAQEPLHGYTIYCWPGSLTGACNRCAAHIIQTGLAGVVYELEDNENVRRRNGDPEITLSMFREAGVVTVGLTGDTEKPLILSDVMAT